MRGSQQHSFIKQQCSLEQLNREVAVIKRIGHETSGEQRTTRQPRMSQRVRQRTREYGAERESEKERESASERPQVRARQTRTKIHPVPFTTPTRRWRCVVSASLNHQTIDVGGANSAEVGHVRSLFFFRTRLIASRNRAIEIDFSTRAFISGIRFRRGKSIGFERPPRTKRDGAGCDCSLFWYRISYVCINYRSKAEVMSLIRI